MAKDKVVGLINGKPLMQSQMKNIHQLLQQEMECEMAKVPKTDDEAAWQKFEEQLKIEDAKRDKVFKERGYTHKVNMWVHPKVGGDDYEQVVYFRGKPKEGKVELMLKRRRSAVLTDYSVRIL